jgi:Tfp pilus assembly protein PilX
VNGRTIIHDQIRRRRLRGQPFHSQLSGRAARRGLVLVAVLVCLAAAAMTILAILRTTMIELKQLRAQQQHLQADRLAEAGIERAHAQLNRSPTYTGETWTIAADELGGTAAASVLITVTEVQDQANQRQIRAQADYPNDSDRRVRKSRDTIANLP